jgi:N-acetylglucosamine kinase-like BadF-type ATPase
MHRIGGWGNLFGRGGSAYDLGRDAIRATLAAEEKLIPDGALTRCVREKLGAEAHAALADIYKNGKAYIASFARKAVECAENGDPVAVEIIDESISALCKRVAKAKELYGDCPELICGGGLFNSKYFFYSFKEPSITPFIKYFWK